MMVWLTIAAGLGVISALLAYGKGRSPWGWGACGTLFGVIVIPYLIFKDTRSDEMRSHAPRFGLPAQGGFCRECGTRVEADAVVCRVCRHPLSAGPGGSAARPKDGGAENANDEKGKKASTRKGKAKVDPSEEVGARIFADVTMEEASRDPLFSSLDDAFSRLTDKPTAETSEQPARGSAKPSAKRPVEESAPRPKEQEVPAAAASVSTEEPKQAKSKDAGRIVFPWTTWESRLDTSKPTMRERIQRAEAAARKEAEQRAKEQREEPAAKKPEPEMALRMDPSLRVEEEPAEPRLSHRIASDPDDRIGASTAWRSRKPGLAQRMSAWLHGEVAGFRKVFRVALLGTVSAAVIVLALNMAPPESEGPAPPTESDGPVEKSAEKAVDDEAADRTAAVPPSETAPAETGKGGLVPPPLDLRTAGEAQTTDDEAGGGSETQMAEVTPPEPLSPAGEAAGGDVTRQPETGKRVFEPAPPRESEEAVATVENKVPQPMKTEPEAPKSKVIASSDDTPAQTAETQVQDPPRNVSGRAEEAQPATDTAAATPTNRDTDIDDLVGTVQKALAEHRGRQLASLRQGNDDGRGVTAQGEIIALVQQRLRERGYYEGTVDGLAGPQTRTAIKDLQRSLDRQVDGEIDAALLEYLGIAGKPVYAFEKNGIPLGTLP